MFKALFATLAIAALLSSIATWLDWYQNPGQVFRDQTATHWAIVAETFWSWFWPLALLALLINLLVFMLYRLKKKSTPE